MVFQLLMVLFGTATQTPSLETLLVPGDVLRIDCPRDAKLAGNFTVGEDGFLTLTYGAPLLLEGVPSSQVQAKVRTHLGRYLVGTEDIEVAVVKKFIRCKAMGFVGSPGWKSLPPNADIQDLLRASEGMKDGAQMDKLVITNIHLKAPPESFDMTRYLQRDGGAANRKLRNGDVVFVPLSPVMGDIQRTLMPYVAPPAEGRRNVVNVIGEIANPGVYEVNGQVNIMDLIAMAGGPATPRNSALVLDLENIKVIRQDGRRSSTKTFNMSRYFETGDASLLIQLQAGDNVLVPAKKVDVEDKTKVVSVVGAVEHPVSWEISGPTSIVQVLARSGGFALRDGSVLADSRRIRIVTSDSVVEPTIREWDWNEWIADPAANPPPTLRSNDVVVVPFLDPLESKGAQQATTVTVLGAVRSPGLVPVGSRTDLIQALALAGGLDLVDGEARVVLVREVGGKATRSVFHVRDFFERDPTLSGLSSNPTEYVVPLVVPGDRIWVDRKGSRELAFWLEVFYKIAVSSAVVLSLSQVVSP